MGFGVKVKVNGAKKVQVYRCVYARRVNLQGPCLVQEESSETRQEVGMDHAPLQSETLTLPAPHSPCCQSYRGNSGDAMAFVELPRSDLEF